ncbi:uncharacterized protein N7506_000103 [Penicillium brevicompactum]|uniref:uncharacterized protein n=1 Tax=Penicillium brevicompactum TaxID=5074 RepID=UPI0025418063|nr:uncharacterized protein N7506_000103 [Penicillium brevicompactum]KAJ5346850.1 hypothetical protein N7506_000103 [Penicillium brevicompactum]
MSESLYSEELRAVPQDQRLRSEGQWRVWIGHIRSAAISEDVWEYLNPDLSEESVRQVPEAAQEPQPSSIREDVEDEFELTEKEFTQWTRRIQAYDRRETQRVRLLKVMARMNSLITRSLATEYHYLTVDEVSPHQKLVRLAREFKPKPETRTEELRLAWRAMIKQPANNVNTDHWLTQWTSLYEEAKCADVPDVVYSVKYAIRDFLRAIQPIDDVFCTAWQEKILIHDISFHDVISSYRSRRKALGQSAKKGSSKVALATLDGQHEARLGQNKSKLAEKTYRTRCPCGNGAHTYQQCYYLNKSLRPEGWNPNEAVEKKIPEFIKRMSLQDQEAIAKLAKTESAQFAASEDQRSIEQIISMFSHDLAVQAAQESDEFPLKNSWIVDTGANTHISNDRERFVSFTPADYTVITGDASTRIQGFGTVRVNLTDPETGKTSIGEVSDVRYSPGFHTNLLSASRLKSKGFIMDIELLALVHCGQPIAKLEEKCGLYVLEYRPIPAGFATVKHSQKPLISSATAERWHQRLGHMYDQRIQKLAELVDGIKITGQHIDNAIGNPERCEVCQMTSAKRQISRRVHGTKYGRYGRIHFDLVRIETAYNDDKWMTHFYVEGIRLHAASTHEKKSGCQDAVKHFVAFAITQLKLPIRAFRYDNERAAGRTVEDFLRECGFIVEHSVVGTPEMNSFSERSGGVIIARARALLLEAGLPKALWPEAVKAAIYIINRSPTKLPNGQWIIPYAEATGIDHAQPKQRINLSNLRLYGCRAYVRRQDIPKSHKMEPRADIGYLVGYTASNIWRVWFPRRGAVREVRDVVFDENLRYDPKELEKPPISDVIEAMPWEIGEDEHEDIEQLTQLDNQPETNEPASESTQQSPEAIPDVQRQENAFEPPKSPGQPQQTVTPSLTPSAEPQLLPAPQTQQSSQGAFPGDRRPAQHETAHPRAPRDIVGDVSDQNIVTGARNRKPVDQAFTAALEEPEDYHEGVLAAFATGLNAPHLHNLVHRDDLPSEPQNWKEMINHQYHKGFLAAAGLEVDTLTRKSTFEVVQRPTDRSIQILPLKWVFTYKFDSNGFLSKLKARLCIHEYQEKVGSAQYATTITRPDSAKATATLAQFLTNPGPQHLDAINRVISYLYNTRTSAIAYRARDRSQKNSQIPEAVQFFSDASFADNPDRKSSEGYTCMMFGGPVDWKASKQRTVTTSTTEAELLAISEAARTVAMWKRLFKAIRFDPEHELSIRCDNQQTIGILEKETPQLRTKLRHIDIHQHWLRQEVQSKRINVHWVRTADMIADGLTKLLPRQKHLGFMQSMAVAM